MAQQDKTLAVLLYEVLHLIAKYKYLFLVLNILLIAIAIFYETQRLPKYKSKMTAISTYLSDGRVIDLLEDLDQFAQIGDYQSLARFLNMPIDKAKSIVQIKGVSAYANDTDRGIEEDKYNMIGGNQFNIVVYVTDLSILDELQLGIKYYIESRPFVQRLHQTQVRANKIMISKIEAKLNSLDSLMLMPRPIITSKGNAEELMLIAPEDVASFQLELNDRLLRLDHNLKLGEPIRILQEFKQFNHKTNTPIWLISFLLLSFGNIGLLLGIQLLQGYLKYQKILKQ